MAKIEFIPITGKLVSHGNATGPKTKDGSNPKSIWTYSYLVFREDETGEEITVKDCKVHGVLNQHLAPGTYGTWLLSKSFVEKNLLAYRSDKNQTLDERILNPKSLDGSVGSAAIIGILLTITGLGAIIGIPLILYSIYLFIKLKDLPKTVNDLLTDNGFKLQAARTI